MSILDKYKLTYVINVSGTMTSLGASLVGAEAVEDAALIQSEFVRIDEAQKRAGEIISRLTGAEAGCVTACSAAAMTICTAAAMTETNLARIEQLPDTTGMKNEVVISSGHMVNYGAPVEQSIRLAGARVVPFGSAALSHAFHLEAAITKNTAAAMFVVSHHVVQEGQIPLEDVIAVCRERGVPVIVDMASEYDLRGPAAMGASAVIYSAHKFLGGPTGGVIAGRRDFIRAAYLQNRGIGRQMKIGKEGVIGVAAALETWERRDHAAAKAREDATVSGWEAALTDVPGLKLSRHADWTGNPIDRLKIDVIAEDAGLHAWELASRLAAGTPSIQVRDDLIEHGFFFLDPCNLRPGRDEAETVARRIREEVESARKKGDGCKATYPEWRRAAAAGVLNWPD